MDIMRKFEIPVPKSVMGTNIDEVRAGYKDVIGEGNDCVIKAMVLAGGRGLGHFDNGFQGGVHLCNKGWSDIEGYANKMLGHNLITKQTTAEGLPCTKVMLSERMYMRREMYISIMLDRSAGGLCSLHLLPEELLSRTWRRLHLSSSTRFLSTLLRV